MTEEPTPLLCAMIPRRFANRKNYNQGSRWNFIFYCSSLIIQLVLRMKYFVFATIRICVINGKLFLAVQMIMKYIDDYIAFVSRNSSHPLLLQLDNSYDLNAIEKVLSLLKV